MSVPLRLLILEDNPFDAELAVHEVKRAGFDPIWQCVETEADFLAALTPDLDLILSDYNLPQFDGLLAFDLMVERGFDIPFILVSGAIGEERAVEALKKGVVDYLLKDRLARLGPAITNALRQKQEGQERRDAQAAVINSEMRYRRLFETAQDGILILDAETGAVVDANPFLIELLGLAQEELVGKKVWELGGWGSVFANQNAFAELQQKRYIRYEDLSLRNARGKRIDVEFVSTIYEVNQKEVFQCNLRDITVRKQAEEALRASEERFRMWTENSSDLITVIGEDGTIQYASPSYERVLGYNREELIGINGFELMHPDDFGPALEIFAENIRTPGSVVSVEFRYRHKDGAWRSFEALGKAFTDGHGRMSGLINSRDITERKLAEIQLRENMAELQRWYEATLGREDRVLSLKREVNELLAKMAQSPRYASAGAGTQSTTIKGDEQ